jgi:hypothetical protein
MKFIYLLFYFYFFSINSEKIIKNINIQSCRNCIHYKPIMSDNYFTSPFVKCHKFGEKDIVTDKITYNYADLCRNDESLCGKEGKYFEEEENIDMKILQHSIFKPFNLIIIPYILLIIKMLK